MANRKKKGYHITLGPDAEKLLFDGKEKLEAKLGIKLKLNQYVEMLILNYEKGE